MLLTFLLIVTLTMFYWFPPPIVRLWQRVRGSRNHP